MSSVSHICFTHEEGLRLLENKDMLLNLVRDDIFRKDVISDTDDFATWVLFYGPTGGEVLETSR